MAQLVRVIPKNSIEEVRVELINYRGHDLVGMRVYSDFTKSKEMLPTKKGLTMSVEKLPELIEALQEARSKAEAAGTIRK